MSPVVVQRLRQVRVYLAQDVEEGGVGQVALGGAQGAGLYGRQADDEGVEVGRRGMGTWYLVMGYCRLCGHELPGF
jgi:hypothetical protein